MACGVRTRLTAAPRNETLSRARIAILAVLVGCADPDPDPIPSTPPDERLEAVCDECLGRFRQSFEQLALELRRERTAPTATVLLVDAPRGPLRMRVSADDGSSSILAGDASCSWTDPAEVEPLDAAARAGLEELHWGAHAALLRPLVDRVPGSARWVDADTIRFDADFGPTGPTSWTLDLADERPTSLASDACRVEFVTWSQRPPALPRVVVFSGLDGPRHLRILGDDIHLDDDDFARPTGPDVPSTLEISPGPRPRSPVFQEQREVSWLCVEDPGTWAGRRAACRRLGGKLGAAGQKNGGDPLLFREDDVGWLVIPFVAVGDDDATRYRPAVGERVIDPTQGTEALAVVLAPAGDSLDARIASGRALLERHLADHGRKAGGPLRIVVNLMYEEGLEEGSSRELSTDLRLELPVAR